MTWEVECGVCGQRITYLWQMPAHGTCQPPPPAAVAEPPKAIDQALALERDLKRVWWKAQKFANRLSHRRR